MLNLGSIKNHLCSAILLTTALAGYTRVYKIDPLVKSDTTVIPSGKKEQLYNMGDGRIFSYQKPKAFGFITNLPKDAGGMVSSVFRKQSLPALAWVAGSTAVLMLADQAIVDGVQQFSANNHFHAEEDYTHLIDIKSGKTEISILKAPNNINTAFYQAGQGFPGLIIGLGLYAYGKIHKDYRALSTASQLAETFFLMGAETQLLKRITGRETPGEATQKGGAWHFFPSFKEFQNHTPKYDAFSSGHLATMISTITVLAENYPEKKYIKPVGYTLTALTALAMINNGVHWASDYPLAIVMGYACAMQVVKTSRKILFSSHAKKTSYNLSYTFSYSNGRMIPGIILKF